MYVGAISHGPITQNAFLHKMGIRERTEVSLISHGDKINEMDAFFYISVAKICCG